MYYKNQTFFVAGMSKSGCAATRLLLKRGAKVYVYDDVQTPAVEANINALCNAGAHRVDIENLAQIHLSCDVLVLSPGIAIDNALPVAFRRGGKRIIGEMELGCKNLRANLIAVTGTNGKTTTVTMIDEILKNGGCVAQSCGNIGVPICDCVDLLGEDDFAVAEVSSFQLETVHSLCPHIAVITNITPDHLERHYNFDNYLFLKGRLLSNLRESEFAVLNYDNHAVRELAEKSKGKTILFSATERVSGAYVSGGDIYYFDDRVMSVADLFLKGTHNLENALASICVAKLLGMQNSVINTTLSTFKGVKHRIQFVGTYGGVSYYNDSKGTNPQATATAVECMQKDAVLMLGGKDKGLSYDELFSKLKRSSVFQVVLFGENRYKILASAVKNNYSNVTVCNDFQLAVKMAMNIAKEGQAVLFSPASSSFDMFTDYEERGDKFVELVEKFGKQSDCDE